MRFLSQFSGTRRLACLSLVCAGLVLAGCADDEDMTATGSPFSQALFKDYTDLATQAGAVPAPQSANNDNGFFDDLLSVFESGPDNPAEAVADAFQAKADRAASGAEPEPEIAPADVTAQGLRGRLMRALAQGKDRFPDQSARAQADYDCWVLDSGAVNLSAQAQACRSALNNSLLALENAARPVAPPPPAASPSRASAGCTSICAATGAFRLYGLFRFRFLDPDRGRSRGDHQCDQHRPCRRPIAHHRGRPYRYLRVRRPIISVCRSSAPMWWSKPWWIWARAAPPSRPRAWARPILRSRPATASRKPRTGGRWSRFSPDHC